ncbi:hypothetical protein GPSY_2063 [Paraglaciecola psychrophila 170]|nr:hypothetical protein GPSY_2063 [Paraglaciecola psychrophila 170]
MFFYDLHSYLIEDPLLAHWNEIIDKQVIPINSISDKSSILTKYS